MKSVLKTIGITVASVGTALAGAVNACAYSTAAPNTGDIDDPLTFVIIGGIALAVIVGMTVLSMVLRKKK